VPSLIHDVEYLGEFASVRLELNFAWLMFRVMKFDNTKKRVRMAKFCYRCWWLPL